MRSERGIALVTVIMVLLTLLILSAVFASTAVRLSDSTNESRNSKKALAAADAGVNTAINRLNRTPIGDLSCLADTEVAAQTAVLQQLLFGATVQVNAGECRWSAEERAGNGATFAYAVTPVLYSSATGSGADGTGTSDCGQAVTAGSQLSSLYSLTLTAPNVLKRCITAIGYANGVQRRVQRRVVSSLQLFNGITSDDGDGHDVRVGSDSTGNPVLGATHIGSNGEVSISNATFAGQIELQRTAPDASVGPNVTGAWTSVRREDPFPQSLIDVETPSRASNPTPTCLALPLLVVGCSGHYNAAARVMSISSGQQVTLPAGTYHVCGFSMTGGTLTTLGAVRIYIDTPARAGGGDGLGHSCAGSTSGTFSYTGGLLNTLGAALPGNVQVYAAGLPDGGSHTLQIRPAAGSLFNGMVYAPLSHVNVQRSGSGGTAPTVTAGITARTAAVTGGLTFTGTAGELLGLLPDVRTLSLARLYRPSVWVECRLAPTVAGDPESGCNE